MEKEAIPIPDYEKLAIQFRPKPGFAREWAKLSKASGIVPPHGDDDEASRRFLQLRYKTNQLQRCY